MAGVGCSRRRRCEEELPDKLSLRQSNCTRVCRTSHDFRFDQWIGYRDTFYMHSFPLVSWRASIVYPCKACEPWQVQFIPITSMLFAPSLSCIFLSSWTRWHVVSIYTFYIVLMSKNPVPFVFFNCKPEGFTTWRRGTGGRSPPKDDQRILQTRLSNPSLEQCKAPNLGQTSNDFQSFFHCTSWNLSRSCSCESFDVEGWKP